MTRATWDQTKSERPTTPGRRRGYEKAGRTIRLATEIRAREKRHLSQRELAARLRTIQSAVARLESGNVAPSLLTLDKVADALGVQPKVSLMELDHRVP